MNKDKFKEVDVILEDYDEDNITSVLNKYSEVNTIKQKLTKIEEMLKNRIKVFMKEKNWNRYRNDENNISVSLTTIKREDIDKKQLKFILSDRQYAQVMKTTTYEKLDVITPEHRERLKKYAMGKKI